MKSTDGRFHITYCTNIHPGYDWETTFDNLKVHVPRIKERVCANGPFGLGLRLSNRASEELATNGHMEAFKTWLAANDVYVFTMNGFPYGNFHGEPVKEQVHAPDWTTHERVRYTKRLFDQLAELIPEGISGGISTSPITYRHWHATEAERHQVFEQGAKNLVELVLHLNDLETRTGKYLHLDIEPEPDGLLENTAETVSFFSEYLLPIAIPILGKRLGLETDKASKLVQRYITLCYDICHFSLAFENPEDTFKTLDAAGIRIGKIQVSAALKILSESQGNQRIWDSLSRFDEPIYLHQVTQRIGDSVKTYRDFPEVLSQKPVFTEMRAHFHVPIFLERFEVLQATQDHIVKTLELLKTQAISEHLEIETYTWDVLPDELKKDLSESVIRELRWLLQQLGDHV